MQKTDGDKTEIPTWVIHCSICRCTLSRRERKKERKWRWHLRIVSQQKTRKYVGRNKTERETKTWRDETRLRRNNIPSIHHYKKDVKPPTCCSSWECDMAEDSAALAAVAGWTVVAEKLPLRPSIVLRLKLRSRGLTGSDDLRLELADLWSLAMIACCVSE